MLKIVDTAPLRCLRVGNVAVDKLVFAHCNGPQTLSYWLNSSWMAILSITSQYKHVWQMFSHHKLPRIETSSISYQHKHVVPSIAGSTHVRHLVFAIQICHVKVPLVEKQAFFATNSNVIVYILRCVSGITVISKWPLMSGTGTSVRPGILMIQPRECSGSGDRPTLIGQMVLYMKNRRIHA